jgi:hypothetical protein
MGVLRFSPSFRPTAGYCGEDWAGCGKRVHADHVDGHSHTIVHDQPKQQCRCYRCGHSELMFRNDPSVATLLSDDRRVQAIGGPRTGDRGPVYFSEPEVICRVGAHRKHGGRQKIADDIRGEGGSRARRAYPCELWRTGPGGWPSSAGGIVSDTHLIQAECSGGCQRSERR